jgi:putative acetyltransferase
VKRAARRAPRTTAAPDAAPTPRRFSLRRARPADAAACAAIMRAAVRALPSGVHPARTLAAWSSLPALYHRWAMGPGGETYLVGERSGRRLGYAALQGDELTGLFVRPSAAGQGLGAALVACAARLARRRGKDALRVVAAAHAVSFYARLGFRPARPVHVPLPGGARLEARHMRWSFAGGARARPDR